MQRIAEDSRVPHAATDIQSSKPSITTETTLQLEHAISTRRNRGLKGLRRPHGRWGLAHDRHENDTTGGAPVHTTPPRPTSPPEGAFSPRWVDDPLLTGETDTRMRPPPHSTMTLRQVRENVALCRSGRDEGRRPGRGLFCLLPIIFDL